MSSRMSDLESVPGKNQRQKRLDALRNRMEERNIEGVIVFCSSRHQMLRTSYANYLLGELPLGDIALCIPSRGTSDVPTALISPRWDVKRFRDLAPFNAKGTDDLMGSVVDELHKFPVIRRWAYAGSGRTSHRDWQRLQQASNVPIYSDDTLFLNIEQRDDDELQLIQTAAKIADQGFATLLKVAKPGIYEFELAAEVDGVMRQLGADDNFGLIATGKDIQAIRVPTNRKLELGDTIIAEITPAYRGYFAQVCRTIVLGTVNQEFRETYQMLVQALSAGLHAAMPGKSVATVVGAMDEVFIQNGYEQYTRPPYMRTRSLFKK